MKSTQTVFVVDDDEGALLSVVALLQAHEFDRLVLDIQMPVNDGLELYADLEAVDASMRPRTIFMTGGFPTASVEHSIRESGRPAVRKPFDLAKMLSAVEA